MMMHVHRNSPFCYFIICSNIPCIMGCKGLASWYIIPRSSQNIFCIPQPGIHKFHYHNVKGILAHSIVGVLVASYMTMTLCCMAELQRYIYIPLQKGQTRCQGSAKDHVKQSSTPVVAPMPSAALHPVKHLRIALLSLCVNREDTQ